MGFGIVEIIILMILIAIVFWVITIVSIIGLPLNALQKVSYIVLVLLPILVFVVVPLINNHIVMNYPDLNRIIVLFVAALLVCVYSVALFIYIRKVPKLL